MLSNMGLPGLVLLIIIVAYIWVAFGRSNVGKLEFTHPEREVTRVAPVGYSWTTLIFGGFPALIRGHFIAALILFVAIFATSGLAALVFSFFYNKWYANSLIKKGFVVSSVQGDFDKISSYFKEPLPIMDT
jgi:thiamine transporter ThiT